jgi:hypothetical protein
MTGQRNGIVNFYWSWDDANYAPEMTLFSRIADRGSVPMITWMPQDYRLGQSQPAFSLQSILAGNYDAFVTKWAKAMAKYDRPILMRFAHEMNGSWYPWSTGVSGNTPELYAAVWRKLHGIFTTNGALNLIWVWSPNVENADPALYYPGDEYVDVVGLDGFNNVDWGNWRSFTALFEPTYKRIQTITQKPIIIAEVGTSEGLTVNAKADWIRSAYLKEIPQRFPRVVAVLWFSADMRNLEANSADWRIDSSPQSLAAYRQATEQMHSSFNYWVAASVAAQSNSPSELRVATSQIPLPALEGVNLQSGPIQTDCRDESGHDLMVESQIGSQCIGPDEQYRVLTPRQWTR